MLLPVFCFIISVLSVPVDSAENLNSIESSVYSSYTNPYLQSTNLGQVCQCEENMTSILLENAKDMKHQIKNKTSILKKIKHRATHNNEAMWASISLSLLLIIVIVGVLQTKMWTDQTFLSYPESQPVKYEQYNQKTEIKVRHLLKSQGRSLLSYFSKKKRSKIDSNSLQMESFMQTQADQVDSCFPNDFLLSESSDEDSLSEEDIEYSLNPISGLWEGSHRATRGEVLYKRSGDSRGSYGLLNTNSNTTESMETTETEPLIYIE